MSGGRALRGRARALTTPGGFFLTAVLICCALPVTSAIRDPDFWWHLRAGELILDRRGLLATDPFTYTAADHHWVMHEWLTEVVFAGLYRAGGLGLIVAVLSAVTWLGLLCVFARARLPVPTWRPGAGATVDSPRAHFVAVGAGMVLATIAGYPIWGPRAQMLTFALTCLTLLLTERLLRIGGRAGWALVPLFLVWSNLHSGFIIGAGFMAVVLAAEVVGHRLGLPGTAPAERVRSLARILGACLAIVVINPNGPHIYLYPFETQGSSAQQALIQEWHSPDFHDGLVRAFGLMLLSLVVMVCVNRRVRPRDAALALGTAAMALQSVRHIALFLAAATPLWIEQADSLWSGWRSRRRLPRRAPSGAAAPPLWFRAGVALVAVAAPLYALSAKLSAAVSTGEDSATYADDFPVCAARWLAQAPSGLRIFNQYGEGGYLALRLQAHGDRLFIFGDAALMGDDLLRTYGRVETLDPDWSRILRDSRTDMVVFDVKTPLVDVLVDSPRWIEVYRDAHNAAFVPDTPAGRALRLRLPSPPPTSEGVSDVCAQPDHGSLART